VRNDRGLRVRRRLSWLSEPVRLGFCSSQGLYRH
jgi:hypothetical protein